MQRGLDAETRKQLEDDEKRIISDEHWYLDLPELKASEYVLQAKILHVEITDLKSSYGRGLVCVSTIYLCYC